MDSDRLSGKACPTTIPAPKFIPLGVWLNFDEPRYYKSSVLYVIKRGYDKKCWRTRKNLFPSDSILDLRYQMLEKEGREGRKE